MRKVLEVFIKHLKINYQENNFIFENMFFRSSQTKRAHQILKVILYNSSLSIKVIVKESFPQNFYIQMFFLLWKMCLQRPKPINNMLLNWIFTRERINWITISKKVFKKLISNKLWLFCCSKKPFWAFLIFSDPFGPRNKNVNHEEKVKTQ